MSQWAVKPKNNQPHKAKIVKDYLEEQELQVLPHPPYSPDLAPCDFWLFPTLKEWRGRFIKVFTIWARRPCWSCDPDCLINISFLIALETYIWNLVKIGPVVSEEKSFENRSSSFRGEVVWNCRRTTKAAYTKSSPLRLRWAKTSSTRK